jgi:hypothetical protein
VNNIIVLYIHKNVGLKTDPRTKTTQFINKGKKIGCLVGSKHNNQIYIGWSHCSHHDEFHPHTAKEIALLRMKHDILYGVSDTQPFRIQKAIQQHFMDRCKRYFFNDKKQVTATSKAKAKAKAKAKKK